MGKVLMVSICQEKLHELEFLKPVADILKNKNIHFKICHYTELCTVDEIKKLDQLMKNNIPSIDEVLATELQEFFSREELLEYIDSFSHVVVCGTSLHDNEFVKNIDLFSWVSDARVPILGICGGMQVIGMIFGGELNKKTEIGYYFEDFSKEFLGLKDKQEVFHLHNNYVEFGNDFDVFCEVDGVVQAIKHKKKKIYGVLFHPEVRQKEMMQEFIKNG